MEDLWQAKYDQFRELHRPGDPLILFNVWDAGTAAAAAKTGAKAVATGSASVAAANGFGDGEEVPMAFALANAERIVGAVEVPVTVDFEGGYAADPEGLAKNIALLAATGAIGCNFEDQIVDGDGLWSIPDQCERMKAARRGAGDAFFINARTDIFLKAKPDTHDAAVPTRWPTQELEAAKRDLFAPVVPPPKVEPLEKVAPPPPPPPPAPAAPPVNCRYRGEMSTPSGDRACT